MDDLKMQREIELEEESIQCSIKKYRAALADISKGKGSLADLPPGIRLMKLAIEPMAKAVKQFCLPTAGGQRRNFPARQFLSQFEPEVVALIVAKRVVNSLAARGGFEPIQTLAISITNMLKEELEYQMFREKFPGYLHVVEENLKASTERHKKRVIRRASNYLGVQANMTDVDKLHVGTKLLNLFIQSTKLVETVMVSTGRKRKDGRTKYLYNLAPTSETLEWLEKAHSDCELLEPLYYPMVIPPLEWKGVYGGGYLGKHPRMKLKLVKTRKKEALEALSSAKMSKVYLALNRLQAVPWRINTKILGVLRDVWNRTVPIAGLPSRDIEPLPPKDWTENEEPTKEQLTSWKARAADVYAERVQSRGKRVTGLMKMSIAEMFKDEPAIYFCWTMDWRGRIYPVQNFINPQMDDSGRALLEFAEGKELGHGGLYWLAVHGANCFGVDKAAFDDRVAWVHEHTEQILEAADNPADGSLWWAGADSPFQFLAFCFEYAAALRSGNPLSFVSHLPVGMDGSCNGLQNFSGMLRDPDGGAATNLVPSDRPADVYQQVADVLTRMVENDVRAGDECAKLWLGKITRKVTKRGVMTTPYGVTLPGLRHQLKYELKRIDPDYLGVNDEYPAISYLAPKLYEAIGEVVVAARLAMDWLQEVARICSKADVPIQWTTPVGFRPLQDYRIADVLQIDTYWGSLRVTLKLRQDTEALDKRKQAHGIAPNFVHSLDATHLMLTVLKGHEAGITAWSMVHDSYATHAADIPVMHEILREAFIEMYTEDRLMQFRDEVAAQLPPEVAAEIPPLPERGTLDLSLVRESQYFFA